MNHDLGLLALLAYALLPLIFRRILLEIPYGIDSRRWWITKRYDEYDVYAYETDEDKEKRESLSFFLHFYLILGPIMIPWTIFFYIRLAIRHARLAWQKSRKTRPESEIEKARREFSKITKKELRIKAALAKIGDEKAKIRLRFPTESYRSREANELALEERAAIEAEEEAAQAKAHS